MISEPKLWNCGSRRVRLAADGPREARAHVKRRRVREKVRQRMFAVAKRVLFRSSAMPKLKGSFSRTRARHHHHRARIAINRLLLSMLSAA